MHAAAQQGHFLETLRGIRTIKLLGLEGKRNVAWSNRLIDSVNAGLRLKRFDIVFARTNNGIFGVDRLLMLILGARMVLNGHMSIGMLVAFLSYRDQLASRLGSLIGAGFKIRTLKVQCDRLSDIALAEAEQISDDRTFLPILPPTDPNIPALECRNLGYRYGQEDAWVFRNISFTVPTGRSLVITGPSGCGKSTLLSIMMGLIPPEEGQILWNGVELGAQNREAFRSVIAGVLQDDILLSGSLAENIAGFDTDIDLERVAQCAHAAQLLQDIQKMPMGFETLVSEMGSTLSGGQRQRMIMARALYRKPHILFMDEATSNLDVEREQQITALLNQLAITRVLVAHRPDVIASADYRFEMT
ncbi:peptidase domain-containing ABC transporter [Neokomagataea thailandica]|uniref:ABC transporter ATP-binding protein n=1 Tax=Neokomagataea tanensis NBRC 106556 TaxID=1223519 RepID=A0ABQ0QKS8_9PROT|nr:MULTISPECIES: ATP-binding cassette domain-containing protein [Neokomagataea]GBR48341.1 putative ABC transporter ATP-binding protein [Neokomagataea tanensis NBRC 106556]